MDVRYLESLVRVVESGSIAEAARIQNLTPAAVSQRVQALERQLGVELLSRAGHAAKPSEACLALLPRARHIIRESQLLVADTTPAGLGGPLRVGAISTALTGLLAPALRRLTATAPALHPTIVPGTSRQLYQALQSEQIDAALIVAPPFTIPKGMRATTLRHEALALLAPASAQAGSPAKLLQSQPYLRYDPASWGGRHAEDYLRTHQLELRPLCDLDGLEAIAMLVADGLGASLVPHWSGLERLASGCTITPIPGAHFAREIILLTSAAPDRPAVLELLLNSLSAAAELVPHVPQASGNKKTKKPYIPAE